MLYMWLALVTGYLRADINELIGWMIVSLIAGNLLFHLSKIG